VTNRAFDGAGERVVVHILVRNVGKRDRDVPGLLKTGSAFATIVTVTRSATALLSDTPINSHIEADPKSRPGEGLRSRQQFVASSKSTNQARTSMYR